MLNKKNDFCDIFEYELKKKLSERSKSTFDEIRLLLKSFKFYDLDYIGVLDKMQWARSILKTGLTCFTEEDLLSIFPRYDKNNTGLIDYFNFTNYLYGKEPLKPLPKEPNINVFAPYKNNDNSNNKNNIIEYRNESFNIINKNNYINNNKRNNNIINSKINNYFSNQTNQSTPNLQLKRNNYHFNIRENLSKEMQIKNIFESLLMKIKSRINVNNGVTFYIFAKKLKLLEINNKINLKDLIEIFKDMKLDLTEKDVKNFFIILDYDQMNFLNINDIINIIKGKMSQERRLFVLNKFNEIDKRQKGEINVNFMKILYKNNAKYHPDVVKGTKKEEDVYNQFRLTLEIFLDINKILNDIVSKDQFVDYYSGISASIPDDNYFQNILNAIWDLSKIYTSSNMKYCNNYMNNNNNYYYNININNNQRSLCKSMSSPEIKTQRILRTPYYNNNNSKNLLQMNLNSINNRYNQNPNENNIAQNKEEGERNINNIGNENENYISDPYYRPKITPGGKGIKLFKRIIYNPITKELLYSDDYNARYKNQINESDLSPMKRYKNNKYLFDEEKYNEQQLIELFNKFRNILISKGEKYIFNLQKLLSELDTDNRPFLITFDEFWEIIQKLRINDLTFEEIKQLFAFLDINNTGFINYDTFFKNLVGNMGRTRQLLVRTIYASLRQDQYGNIFTKDVQYLFNAEKYNELLGGRKTKEYIYYEFIDNLGIFLNYRNKLYNNYKKKMNSLMNYDDFLRFFSQISMYFDTDDVFEKYIDSCWKIGVSNTSRENKRKIKYNNLTNNRSSMYKAGGHIINW